jgi:hypothetical protein
VLVEALDTGIMTTHRLGMYCLIGEVIGFILFGFAVILYDVIHTSPLIPLVVPLVCSLSAYLIVTCTRCAKSAFIEELLPKEHRWHEVAILIRLTPEQVCSRCGDDLTTQSWW